MIKKIIALLLTCVSLNAATVLVTWWANPEPDIAGYVVYMGGSAGALPGTTHWVDVGNVTNYVWTGLGPNAPYYVTVSAYNTSGLYSDQADPVGFQLGITGHTASVVLEGVNVLGEVVTTSGYSFTQPGWDGMGNQFFQSVIDGGNISILTASEITGPWTACFSTTFEPDPTLTYRSKVANRLGMVLTNL